MKTMKTKKTNNSLRFLAIVLAGILCMTSAGMTALADTVSGNGMAESPGSVSGNGTGEGGEGSTGQLPQNPVHHCTKESGGSDYTDWDYVYFGSYPQSEVTDADLTAAIDSAIEESGVSGDAGVDVWVNNTKYRRISSSDTTYSDYFGDNTYRYFKWERIKWRVLSNNGSTLFVAADQGLDCKRYNETNTSITWEDSTLRSWLNDSFYHAAFSAEEQEAIVTQTVVNDDNPEYGTEGGNSTSDNVYLLSIDEVTNLDYGFCEDSGVFSASRWVQPTAYSHARGAFTYNSDTYTGGNDNGWWWLRSPGGNPYSAAYVYSYGYVDRYGLHVDYYKEAAVPALHINLSSDLWSSVNDNPSDTTNDGENGQQGNLSDQEEENLGQQDNTSDQGGNDNDPGANGDDRMDTPDDQSLSNGDSAQDFDYTIDETTNTVTVKDYKGTKTSITIPDKIEGKPVTSIGEWSFSENHTLTSVTISDSVTSIGNAAFSADQITEILVSEGNTCFSSRDGVLYNKAGDCLVRYPAGRKGAYRISDGVTKIDDYACANCKELITIALPSGLESVGEYSFIGCSNLNDINLPDSVNSIGQSAFIDCTSLTSLVLPASLTSLGDYVFEYCSKLSEIKVSTENESYASVDGVLFDRAKKTLICYPAGKAGTSYTVPSGVETIQYDSFFGSVLTSIIIPSDVKEIGYFAFNRCERLAYVTMPPSIETIGADIFLGCSSLAQIRTTDGSYVQEWAKSQWLSNLLLLVKEKDLYRTEAEDGTQNEDGDEPDTKDDRTDDNKDGTIGGLTKAVEDDISGGQPDADQSVTDSSNADREQSSGKEQQQSQKEQQQQQQQQQSQQPKPQTPAARTTQPAVVDVVKITSAAKTLFVGKTLSLDAQLDPADASAVITWKSSNTKYATVDADGTVTAKKAGAGKTVTIKAQAEGGNGRSASIKIKIINPVKKIKLKGIKTVKAGKKVTLKATITPSNATNKNLAWSSSNKKYATVSAKGVVKTRKAGAGKTVTITVKAKDGSGKTAAFKIKIKAK